MLAPPADLTDPVAPAWGLEVASADYRPVGFGSHHWLVTETGGRRWFVTVDDLEKGRYAAGEPLDQPFARLAQALDAARAVRLPFVVAPHDPLVRLTSRYAAARYEYLDSVPGEDFGGVTRAVGVQEMLVELHGAGGGVARVEDFVVPHRDSLAAALDGREVADCGPYAAPAAQLIAAHAGRIRSVLDRYDALAAGADLGRAVLTHGEPHAANTMLTVTGWKLIDWDTALVAPPERDLWHLDGDHAVYAAATGVTPLAELLELYRLRWTIAELGEYADRFRRPHHGDANDAESWVQLTETVEETAS